jgi:hypothetical protein
MVPAAMPACKTWVEITRNAKNVRVSSSEVHLRKSEGDEVEWFSHGEAYTVVFDSNGSPFPDKEFHVSKQGSTGSGPIVVRADNENGDHDKYSIFDAKQAGGPRPGRYYPALKVLDTGN